jgi:hypothetical protein
VHLLKGTTIEVKGFSESKVGPKRLGARQRCTTESMRKGLVLRLDSRGYRWSGDIGALEICRCETSHAMGDTGTKFRDRLLDLRRVIVWNKE